MSKKRKRPCVLVETANRIVAISEYGTIRRWLSVTSHERIQRELHRLGYQIVPKRISDEALLKGAAVSDRYRN